MISTEWNFEYWWGVISNVIDYFLCFWNNRSLLIEEEPELWKSLKNLESTNKQKRKFLFVFSKTMYNNNDANNEEEQNDDKDLYDTFVCNWKGIWKRSTKKKNVFCVVTL